MTGFEGRFLKLKKELTETTKKGIADSVSYDTIIAQAIRTKEDLTKVINSLKKRLKEWYGYYDTAHSIENDLDSFALTEMVLTAPCPPKGPFTKEDINEFKALAQQIKNLHDLKKQEEAYLDRILKEWCPNTFVIAGSLAAKLIEHAGSLERLSRMPASTIQLLGAEKALFRHLRTGARSPKHGVLLNHPLVSKSHDKGKAARLLADKIALAARVDYFKGDPIGEQLRKEIEKKILTF